MFGDLGEKLGGIFERLRGRGALTEQDVGEAIESLGEALLEADVAASLVEEICVSVQRRAIGRELLRSVTPGQQVAKITHEVLVEALQGRMDGGEGGGGKSSDSSRAGADSLKLDGVPPAAILMVGLQGVGKTTTSGKLALHLKRQGRKVLLASLDVSRPAAREQLRVLGRSIGVAVLPEGEGESPEEIARRAMRAGKAEGCAAVILDTAGRGQLEESSMAEMRRIHQATKPTETLLVLDAMLGQSAAHMAREFAERVPLSGLILTRVDGDARGGAALSARHVSGVGIKFLGTGEKSEALEAFHAERIASRILGMGDVAALVEQAEKAAKEREAARAKQRKTGFDMEDLGEQLRQVAGMGGLGGILGMLPGIGGIGKLKKRLAAEGGGGLGGMMDEGQLRRFTAIISSMTRKERANPKLFNASRKRRVAAGAGASVQEVNQLLKFYRQITDLMRKSGGFPSGKAIPSALPASPPEMPPGLQGLQGMALPPLAEGSEGGMPGLGGPGLGGMGFGGMPGLGRAGLGMPGLPGRGKYSRGGKRRGSKRK